MRFVSWLRRGAPPGSNCGSRPGWRFAVYMAVKAGVELRLIDPDVGFLEGICLAGSRHLPAARRASWAL